MIIFFFFVSRYDVDLLVGMCSCPFGQSGAVCKHQVGVSEAHMMALPQKYIPTKENRRALAAVSLGDDHVSGEFFSSMKDSSNSEDDFEMESSIFKEEPQQWQSAGNDPFIHRPILHSIWYPF